MNQLMAEVLPGSLRAAVFPSSGAEANEAGIMMAKRYTGRKKGEYLLLAVQNFHQIARQESFRIL